jgi:hypothetical protein
VLTGQVLAINNDSISFHNSALGELIIPWTTVAQVESHNRVITPSAENGPQRPAFAFKNAVFTHPKDVVTEQLDNGQPHIEFAALTFTQPPCDDTAQTPSRSTASAKTGFISRWLLSVNAPASFTFGTASQITLGGSGVLDFNEGKPNHSKLSISGNHNRSWQIGSPSVITDTVNAFVHQARSLGETRGDIYGRAETYLNTSLGIAREDSFGGGYSSPSYFKGPFDFEWAADLRYFRQRLYATNALNLIGSRFEVDLNYKKKDSDDKTKIKYDVNFTAWINPMWNNESTLRGFAWIRITFPIKHSVCFSFNPIEDDYLRNPPSGNRRNYATTSITLVVLRNSNPKKGCY